MPGVFRTSPLSPILLASRSRSGRGEFSLPRDVSIAQ